MPRRRPKKPDEPERIKLGRGPGFAIVPKALHHALSVKGGRAAQASGTAHRWTKDEALVASKKGALCKRLMGMGRYTRRR